MLPELISLGKIQRSGVSKLKLDFYTRKDTIVIAKELLGKTLVSNFNGKLTSGIICETEAYCGREDRGCHAYKGRFTPRTEIMYAEGGCNLCVSLLRSALFV